jgi:endonuclease/exonuclease/phosphatase family metal-dependent hydrolase
MAKTLRVITYNVHSCIGGDQRFGPERVLRLIRRFLPDVVALQELDIGQHRTQGLDQAEFFARGLSMQLHFVPARERLGGHYGNAILTRRPSRLLHSGCLPRLHDACEPRAALWVAVDTDFGEVHVLNVHLGLQRRERGLQTEALLGRSWLTDPRRGELAVVCGDFNATPGSAVYTRFAERLTDAQLAAGLVRPTFPAIWPLVRIDHVFVTPRLRVVGASVPASLMARVASDHRPLLADVALADA